MDEQRKALAKKIYKVCYLTGEFKLRSGEISNQYFDKYLFISNPELLQQIGEEMGEQISINAESHADYPVVAGLELGGVPLATVISIGKGTFGQLFMPIVCVRKEVKKYGTCKQIEGCSVNGKDVVVIEDIVSTGKSVVNAVNSLRDAGAIVKDVFCVINRGGEQAIMNLRPYDINLYSLFTIDELKRLNEENNG